MTDVFRYERLLHWGECDPAGLIFFPNYARWIVEGVNLLFLSGGLDPVGSVSGAVRGGLPAVACEMQFLSPAKLHDQVMHEIAVAKLGRKSITFHHRFFRGDVCLAEAKDVRVWVQEEGGEMQSIPIPEKARNMLEPFLNRHEASGSTRLEESGA